MTPQSAPGARRLLIGVVAAGVAVLAAAALFALRAGEEPTGRHAHDAGGTAPAGAPLRLALTIGDADERPAATPRLSARRLSPAPSAGAGSARIPLERNELFLLNRRTGEFVIPSGDAGSTDHTHGGQPGAGLAQLSPGGGYAWATRVPGGAAWARADPEGRRALIGYPRAGRVEIVDLLRHARAGAIDTGPAARTVAVAPDGRLWSSLPPERASR